MKKWFYIISLGIIICSELFVIYQIRKRYNSNLEIVAATSEYKESQLRESLINRVEGYNYEGVILDDSIECVTANKKKFILKNYFEKDKIILFIPKSYCSSCYESSLMTISKVLGSSKYQDIVILTNFDNIRVSEVFKQVVGFKNEIINVDKINLGTSKQFDKIFLAYLTHNLELNNIFVISKANIFGIEEYIKYHEKSNEHDN